MLIKCEYCGNYFDDSLEHCEYCGAINKHIKRGSNEVPKTIEELKKYCDEKKFPLDKLHFYIGEDYKGAKAFGIYQDERTSKFIVYKNKSNGERVIRYEGTDEAYAVNEIYIKLKEKSLEYKSYYIKRKSNEMPTSNRIYSTKMPIDYPYIDYAKEEQREKRNKLIKWCFLFMFGIPIIIQLISILILFLAFSFANLENVPSSGYYNYNDNTYYNYNDDWYLYEDDTWIEYDNTNFTNYFYDNFDSFYMGGTYSDTFNVSDFTTTDYYDSYTYSSDYSYDYDNDWDSGWDDDWDDYDYDYSYDYDYDDSWDSDW